MTSRTFVYNTLETTPAIVSLVGGSLNPRIFAKKSLTSAIEAHPYIVYKLGNSSNEELAEDQAIDRQYFQVYIHDYHDGKTADYMKIDEIASAIRAAFLNLGSKADGVWTVRYLETSQDLNDDTLNTVFRYLRFQLIKKEI